MTFQAARSSTNRAHLIPVRWAEEAIVDRATLLVIQGVDQGNRFLIGPEPAGIGRGVRNEIRILDTEVSRQHAVIEFENGAFVVKDRGSSNGTFVNGAPVRSHTLSSGDQIHCGRTVLLFTDPQADDESEYAAKSVELLPDDHSQVIATVQQRETDGDAAEEQPEEAERDPKRTISNLQALYRISEEAVTPSISLDQLLKRILAVTVEVVGADRGCILIRDPETDEITPQTFSHRTESEEASGARMPISRSIVNYVLQDGDAVRTTDAQHDQRFDPGQSIVQAGIREAMCVPMQGRRELLGVVYVDTTIPPGRSPLDSVGDPTFTDEHLRLLAAIGRQTAQAVENNRYQKALVNAERLAAMGQTIAMLSHHIKNILQGVRGGSYLIDMGLGDHNEELVRKGWGIVEKNQSKIYNLVMDMLTFSKERQPVLESADINETVGDVCELMQSRAEECEVALEFQPGADLPATTFDKEGIHRAVLNVVTNAIDATEGEPDAKVVVTTNWDAESDAFSVEVADNGPGIPAEQLPKLFHLFESTKGARGTGLGLAVSQKIIREHGGSIQVASQEGEGSQFTLSWPRFVEEQRPAEEEV